MDSYSIRSSSLYQRERKTLCILTDPALSLGLGVDAVGWFVFKAKREREMVLKSSLKIARYRKGRSDVD